MDTVFIVIALLAATGLATFGFHRIRIARKPGLEGIEDQEAAEAYDRINTWPQFRLLRRLFAARLAKHHPKGTLADIGCGPGRLAILVARQHPSLHVIGVDAADEMVRTATSNASSLGLSKRVEFRIGDVASLPIPDASIDFVVSTFSLHHWSDAARGLAEMHRVLRPGGQLLLFDLRRDAWRLVYWLLRFAQRVVVPKPLRRANEPLGSLLSSYTLAETQQLVRRLPFQETKADGGPAWLFAWGVKDLREAA